MPHCTVLSVDSNCLPTLRLARQASTTRLAKQQVSLSKEAGVLSCITRRRFQKRSDSRHVSIFGYLSLHVFERMTAIPQAQL